MDMEMLHDIADFINSVGMKASVIEKTKEIPFHTLLAGLCGEVEEGHMVVLNPMDLEEDGGFTEHWRMYYELPVDMSDIAEGVLYQAVNVVNGFVPLGYFIFEPGKGTSKRVSMRHTITYDVEDGLSPGMVCECVQLMLEYGAVMEEVLAGLSSGMALEDVLKAEGLALEV